MESELIELVTVELERIETELMNHDLPATSDRTTNLKPWFRIRPRLIVREG
jgi:hypothetical protein